MGVIDLMDLGQENTGANDAFRTDLPIGQLSQYNYAGWQKVAASTVVAPSMRNYFSSFFVKLPAVGDSASSAVSYGKISSCVCTICKVIIQISCNKTSNIVSHIKHAHSDQVMMPFECIPEHVVKRKMCDWESLKVPQVLQNLTQSVFSLHARLKFKQP